MPDLTHDAADDGFHEIHLNGKQLVFLFIVTTLLSVAIFLCGVLVGRGARAARGEEPAPIAAADAATAPQPVTDPAPSAAGPPAAEPPPPATESPDELSYHKRLQGDAAPTEALKAPAPNTAPKPAPAVASAAKAPAPPAPAPAAARVAGDVPSAGKPGIWVVQVQALRDRAVAVSLVNRLTGQGYPAFLVTPSPDSAPPFYKVHVGRYNDRREAEQVKRRLEKEEQFKPWISR